jgi:hypothetical protein
MHDYDEGWSPVKELLRVRIRYGEYAEVSDFEWPANYNPENDPYLNSASNGEISGIWPSDIMAIYMHYNFTKMAESGWGLEEFLIQAVTDVGIGFGSVIPEYSNLVSSGLAIRTGRLGGPSHQAAIQEIREGVKSVYGRDYRTQSEFQVKTPGGMKSYRYVDVAVLGPDGQPVAFYQVGVSTSGGALVSRERYAIADIYEYGGYRVPIYFIPYR